MGAVLPILGGLLTGVSNAFNAASQVWQNKKNMELQRETWMREDSAVQRRVNDLKAAGLSPVLAAGAAAQTSGPIQVGAPQINAGSGINKAVELMKMKQEIAVSEAQKQALMSTVNKNNMDTLVAGKEVEKKGLEVQRLNLENAIRARDFDIIKRLGIRSDVNGQAANLGQLLEGGKTLVSKIGSSPVISAAVEEAGKTIFPTKLGDLVWDKKMRRYVQESSSGSQPLRKPGNR